MSKMPSSDHAGYAFRKSNWSIIFFVPLKKVEGRCSAISTEPDVAERTGQRGIAEKFRCAKCDNERLQRDEEHWAQVFNGGRALQVRWWLKKCGPVNS